MNETFVGDWSKDFGPAYLLPAGRKGQAGKPE